jgi:hypothetical protein
MGHGVARLRDQKTAIFVMAATRKRVLRVTAKRRLNYGGFIGWENSADISDD